MYITPDLCINEIYQIFKNKSSGIGPGFNYESQMISCIKHGDRYGEGYHPSILYFKVYLSGHKSIHQNALTNIINHFIGLKVCVCGKSLGGQRIGTNWNTYTNTNIDTNTKEYKHKYKSTFYSPQSLPVQQEPLQP